MTTSASAGSATSSPAATEHVLVVPTLLFYEIGYFQGFCPDATPYLKTLLDPAFTSYRARHEMEADPSYKQLIPYCILRCAGQIFCYTRGTQQGEARLHAKRSIGVGGHISTQDAHASHGAYLAGMRRELEEEVHIETEFTDQCVGLINDDATDVGRVHLGIVHIFELAAPKVRPREKSMIEAGFATSAELVRDRARFETWSQICLDQLGRAGWSP